MIKGFLKNAFTFIMVFSMTLVFAVGAISLRNTHQNFVPAYTVIKYYTTIPDAQSLFASNALINPSASNLTQGSGVWAFGSGCFGQLGDGASGVAHCGCCFGSVGSSGNPNCNRSPRTHQRQAPAEINPGGVGVNFTQISAGSTHTIALDENGNLWGWGMNEFGQLGCGTTRPIPRYRLVSERQRVGHEYVRQEWWHVIPTRRYIYENVYTSRRVAGQYDQISANSNTPVRLLPTTYHAPFKAVAAGDNHSLALDTDGRLWVWGASLSLQLTSVAVGSTIATPTRVNVDTTFSAISAGYGFALAIDATNNRLHAWGSNSDGQLGMGSGRPETQFKAIAAGVSTSMGISTSGGLYVWGFNGEDSWGFDGESSNLGGGGFLGDGTTTNRRSPTRIMSPTQFKYIANGGSHKLAICIDGYLFAWGSNFAGQLGDWSNTDRRTPTQITNALRFQQVTAGINHSMALCVNYNLWAFGDNSFGQLGDGTQSNRRTPTPIMSGTRFSAVSSGGSFTIALQKAAPPVVLPDPTVTITAEDNHLLIPYQQVDQPPIVMPTLQLSAHITGLEQGNIQKVWSVSNSQVASINQNGLLTAVGAGEAVVTLTLNQNFTATFAIYITQEDPPDEYYYCYFGCCYDGYVYLPGIGMPGIDPDVCLCECYYCGDDCYYCDDNCYFCEYCNYNCCDNGGDNGGGIIGPPPDTNIGGGTIQQNNRITDLDETTQMIIAISAGGGVGLGLIIVVRIARAIRLRRPFKDF